MKSLHQHASIFPLLAENLNEVLHGFYLQDAFAASKEELNLIFVKDKEQLSLALNVEAKTGLLFFYDKELNREGGANPLFKGLLGQCITSVISHQNNRSFAIKFENKQQLIFKLYGGLSNVLLADEEKVLSLFRSSIQNDRNYSLSDLNQNHVIEPIITDTHFYICSTENGFKRELNFITEPEGTIVWQGSHILEGMHEFAIQFLQQFRYQSLKAELEQKFSRQLKGKKATLIASESRLIQLDEEIPPEELGHILMANLHNVKKGETEVNLFDFYRNQPISIKIKKDLTPADNAAHYYKKAKNRTLEKHQFEKRVLQLKTEISELELLLAKVLTALKFKELRAIQPESKQQKRLVQPDKFKHFLYKEFDIYVGKNSENNDELTQRFAKKDDLWLHARGVGGSHVVIKRKPSKDFPKEVIEYAAQLAAYYSKAKGSGLVPVIYTPKKFVRKPKGANPGQVLVEKEEVTMVEPRKPADN